MGSPAAAAPPSERLRPEPISYDAPPHHASPVQDNDASPEPPPASPAADARGVRQLGATLAEALEHGGYHPVVLFGTSASGKTSLLLSLLALLKSRPELRTGLHLCPPLLGAANPYGQRIHGDAQQLFEVLTEAFVRGEKIPATRSQLPFFVPVELRPKNKPIARIAFLESDGEWYRPLTTDGMPVAGMRTLFKEWRHEIEEFVAAYRHPITFIYLAPYTQVDGDEDRMADRQQIASASLAIQGVIQTYDRVRGDQRHSDRHLLLVTKWDARGLQGAAGSEVFVEDAGVLEGLLGGRYSQAYSAFLNLPGERHRNAYSSGVIGPSGLRQPRDQDEALAVASYPSKLWSWLYRNALLSRGDAGVSLFPEPPREPTLVRFWKRTLDYISGR